MRWSFHLCMLVAGLAQAQFIEYSFPAPSENISGLAGLCVLDSLDCKIYIVEDYTGAVLATIDLPPLPNPAVGLARNTDSLWFAESGTAIIHAIDFDGNLLGTWDFSDSGIQTITGLGILSYSSFDCMYLLDSSDRSIYRLLMPIGSEPIDYLFTISDTIEVYDICGEVSEGIPVACNDEVSPVRIYSSASNYQELGFGTYASAAGVGSSYYGNRFYFNDPELGLIHRYCLDMGGAENESSICLGLSILSISPNPALGSATLSIDLISGGSIAIQLYDLGGRLVQSADAGFYPSGHHEITVVLPHAGTYICRMTSGDFSATQRFVVIE